MQLNLLFFAMAAICHSRVFRPIRVLLTVAALSGV